MIRRVLNHCAIVAAILTPVHQLTGQTVRGVLRNATTGLPVTAGFVVLVDEDSAEQQRTLVDGRGVFRIGADGPGRYALKSQVIGLSSTTSPYFELRVGQVREYDFSVPALPVQLGALVVEEERVCRTRSESGLTATTLWNEAQKALNAVLWTEQQSLLRHRLVRYERLLEPVTLDVADEGRTWTQDGLYRGSPFGSVPAEDLAAHGFIRDAGSNEWIYDGPDARVLLSDVFANSHCFSAREPSADNPGLIGLAFEPTTDSDRPDVAGVLWLDEETAELRFVEYRYTDPPWDLEFSDAGGRIEFERLDTGVWIVRRWWIRMPVIGLRAMQTVQIGRTLDQYYLAAVRETGAWVADVTTSDGRSAGGIAEPSIEGFVDPFADPSAAARDLSDHRTGVLIGLNVNLFSTGSDVARFEPAPAFQGTLRLATEWGFQLAGGAQFSKHGIREARQNYDLFQMYVEPRFALLRWSSNVTPFVGARVGHAWEYVFDTGASFKATGVAFGGVGGAVLRLDNRVSLETGFTLGKISFGNFRTSTDRRWNECVGEQGDLGVPLPATVAVCSPPEFWTGPQLTPGTGLTGTGAQPYVEHANTARRDVWRGFWVGFVLRLSGR